MIPAVGKLTEYHCFAKVKTLTMERGRGNSGLHGLGVNEEGVRQWSRSRMTRNEDMAWTREVVRQ